MTVDDQSSDDLRLPASARDHAAIGEAYELWQRGRAAEAEAKCYVVLDEARDHPDALYLLARIARAAGERDRALHLLRRACARPDASCSLHVERAQLLRETGLLDEAEEAGRRSLAIDPKQARAWHDLALTLILGEKLNEARDVLNRALALDPAATDLHNNLAIVLHRLADLEGARKHYDAALVRAPDNAEIHNNLAALLMALGQYEDGLEEARRAAALRPGFINAHVHAAMIEMELERLEPALQWIEEILAAASDRIEVLLVHAEILGKLGRLEEALVVCHRAIALRPLDGNAHNLLGRELQALGRDDEALHAFAHAGVLMVRPGIPLANQAGLLCQLGRAEEARAVLGHALALDPDCASVWYVQALMKRYTVGDPDLGAMEALLRENRVATCNERLFLHYALGNAYLDANEGDRAFAHLAEGALIKRSRITYDGAATERWLAEISEAFPATLFAGNPKRGLDSELPIFVIGMPRSGTTLVEQIVGSHPAVYAAGEISDLEQAIGRVLPSGASARAFPSAFAHERRNEVGKDYLDHIAALAPQASRIVDKMMSNIVYAGLIHLMLPRARIILCRRDPIDTCLSCYSKLFAKGIEFSYDLGELGHYFRAQDALAAHWREVLPPTIFLEIDYESVVADLEAAARRLVAFCGLPWSPACLAYYETKRPIRTASMTQVRQPIYRASIGRWLPFRAQLAPLLEALGMTEERDTNYLSTDADL